MKQSSGSTILNIVQAARDMEIGEILYPHDMRRAMTSANRALTDDGRATPEAVSDFTWQRSTWYFDTPTVGSNVGAVYPLPQGAVIRQVMIHAKTAPSGGSALVTIESGAGAAIAVSLLSTETYTSSAMIRTVQPGGALTLNVIGVNGAAGLTVTVFTAPHGGS